MTPTIQSLREKWEGMSDDDKNAQLLVLLFDWRWECWPSLFDGVLRASLVPPRNSEWEPCNYPHTLAKPCSEDHPRFSDWATNPTNRKTQEWGLPRYTSEDSPRSLVSGLEEKTIEKASLGNWLSMLLIVTGAKTTRRHTASMVARATADQRCEACWLAVMLEGGK